MTSTEQQPTYRIVPSTFEGAASSAAAPAAHPHHSPQHGGHPHASSDGQPGASTQHGYGGGQTPRGVQSVKFSFYRVSDRARRASKSERTDLGKRLTRLLEESGKQMLTRVYSTVGTRGDTDFLIWQAHDDLRTITDWHADLLRSPLGGALERPHSFLSMTMRSLYTNDLHEGLEKRTKIRTDGGVNRYLFVYPMAKTRAWYELPTAERQRMMNEHIEIGHKYHGIKINTTYSYGLDDQEFVVAFEGDDPGEFLALVRELRDSEASSYTLFDTPMFTCRMLDPHELADHIGLTSR